eukprot:1063187-Pyramimonas_sp.AAC.1
MWTQAVRHAIRVTNSKLVPLAQALPKMPTAAAPMMTLASAASKQAASSAATLGHSAKSLLPPAVTAAGAAVRLSATATP